MTDGAAPRGFLLITADPLTARGGKGYAWHLVRDRLSGGRWPLFEKTPNRAAMRPGMPVAFYVGGHDRFSGRIIARARISDVSRWSSARGRIDPARYATEVPVQVLLLDGVEYLDPPVNFREVLPALTIRPKNLRVWGSVLMGGVRALNDADWTLLVGDRPIGPPPFVTGTP